MRKLIVLAGILLCSAAGSAFGAPFTLSFGQSSYKPEPGQTVNIDVYLSDAGGDLSASGLAYASMYIEQTSGPTGVLQFSGLTVNPDFELSFFEGIGLGGFTAMDFDSFPSPGVGQGSNSVLLGTLSYLVTGNIGQTITIAPREILPGNSFELNDDLGTVFSPALVSSTVTVTPEPTSLAIFGVVAGIGALGHWNRRRRKAGVA